VLLDYVDFVIHIFSEQARSHYNLERLWKSAKKLTPAELRRPERAGAAEKRVAGSRMVVKRSAKKASNKQPSRATSVRSTAKKSSRRSTSSRTTTARKKK
jgi:ribosome-associated protein